MVITSFQQNVNQARLNVQKARQESLIREKKLRDLIRQLNQRDRTDRSFVGTRRRTSSLLQNVNQAIRNRDRAKLSRQSAKNTLSRFEAAQRKSLGKISKRQASREREKTFKTTIDGITFKGSKKFIERQIKKKRDSLKIKTKKVTLKKKVLVRRAIPTPREKRIEKETRLRVRRIPTKGTLEAPKQTKIQRLQEILTPRKDRKDKGFKRGLKGGARFVTDTLIDLGKGTLVLVKAGTGNIIAKARISKTISNFSLAAIGVGLGKLVQSKDPFLRTQGILSIVPIAFPIKVISKIKIIDTVKPTFKTKINAKTGNSFTIIKRQGKLEDGRKVKIESELKASGKTGNVKVKNKVTIEGKSKTDRTILKNEGGFFRDTKTGKIIEKQQITPDKIQYKITQVTTNIKPKRNVIRGDTITIVGVGTATSKTIKGVIEKGKKREVVITRVSAVDAAVSKALRPIDVVAFKRFFTVTASRKRLSQSKKISDADLRRFLQAVRFEKEIVAGLDRRGRVARALGLRRDSPIVKNISKFGKDNIKIFTGKGVIRAKGVIEGFVIKKVKTKRNALFESKRATTLFFNQNKFIIPKGKKIPVNQLSEVLKIPKKITIPKLKSHIKNVIRLKVKGIIPAIKLKNYLARANKFIQEQKSIQRTPVRIPAKARTILKVRAIAIAKATPALTKSKPLLKQKPFPSPGRRIALPRVRTPVVGVPILIFIRLKGLKRKGSRQGFIIRIKQGNRIIAESKSTLPRKRAINFMRRRLDNTPQASGEIVRKGKTSIVDVKKTILGNKFRPKRSKDPKVRIQVEKRKFRLDTRGETKGLRRSPRKRTKKTKKSKRLKRLKRKK